jgi:hypothetical protein
MDQSIKFFYNITTSIQDNNRHQVKSPELHVLNEIIFMYFLSIKNQFYLL